MRYAIAIVLALLVASPVFAGDKGRPAPGSYTGPTSGAEASTVKAALEKADDSIVQLTGKIISKIAGKDDKYMFRDDTGEVIADIDHKYFGGRQISDKDTVRITGKVDKDFGEPTKIDVKNIEIINQ